MRARMLFLVVAILLVAAFVALNWSEFLRTSPLTFGGAVLEAPLGLIMLGILGVVFAMYIVTGAVYRTQHLVESHHHLKALQQQRDLADKAEASRFTDLRQHLDTQLRELRQRDAIAATEFEKAMVGSQRELRTQLDQMNRAMTARISELEHRLEARLERLGGVRTVVPPRAELPAEPLRGHAPAEQARDVQLREEHLRDEALREERLHDERVQQERLRQEQARAQAVEKVREEQRDRPNNESGWRKWF
jgi:hypothetical protein